VVENVLGISSFFHDSAVALLKDGQIAFAAQEERYSRLKNDSQFPLAALTDCLRHSGITERDVAHVAYYENPATKFSRVWQSQLIRAPWGLRSFDSMMARWTQVYLPMKETLGKALGKTFRGEIHCTEHHGAHAASAFYPSPFEEAAILTIDAVGECATSTIGTGKANEIELSHEMRFPYSVGLLYSTFTYYLGFEVNEGEYKVMGLAPYGEPVFKEQVLAMVRADESGAFRLDMSYFNFVHGQTMTTEKFHLLFGGPPRSPSAPITQRHADLAATIQRVCEELVLGAVHECHRITRMKNLCMAGGVALNCVVNGRIQREGPFENVWIQPAAGDAGSAVGAALLVWHQLLGKSRESPRQDSQQGSFLGPAFSNSDIRCYLDSVGAIYEFLDEEPVLLRRVARLLAKECTMGWFSGRMEYGPRALGARSILADPRPTSMQRRLNQSIKFRESFRPFAAAVLREHVAEYFEVPTQGRDSPYMLFVHPVAQHLRCEDAAGQEPAQGDNWSARLGQKRATLQAVTHVDFSSRIQTVDEPRHGRFWRLLREFHRHTDCPVLVNTSFNVRGEPIVRSPEDAFHCFMKTDLDYLVMENCLLEKARQPTGLRDYITNSF
jgi:carbamoyltransferase